MRFEVLILSQSEMIMESTSNRCRFDVESIKLTSNRCRFDVDFNIISDWIEAVKESHRTLKSDRKETEKSCINAEEELYSTGIAD